MKLKEQIYNKCPTCDHFTTVSQEESYGCDGCKKPIDELLTNKDTTHRHYLQITVFHEVPDSYSEHFEFCSWKCCLKKLLKQRTVDESSIFLPSKRLAMTDQTEHRGWETEADYHEHLLDDPSVDIADAGYGSFAIPISLILILALFGTGFWFLRQYTEPPRITYVAPTTPFYSHDLPPGWVSFGGGLAVAPRWGMHCIKVDGYRQMISPNWGDPACKNPR